MTRECKPSAINHFVTTVIIYRRRRARIYILYICIWRGNFAAKPFECPFIEIYEWRRWELGRTGVWCLRDWIRESVATPVINARLRGGRRRALPPSIVPPPPRSSSTSASWSTGPKRYTTAGNGGGVRFATIYADFSNLRNRSFSTRGAGRNNNQRKQKTRTDHDDTQLQDMLTATFFVHVMRDVWRARYVHSGPSERYHRYWRTHAGEWDLEKSTTHNSLF